MPNMSMARVEELLRAERKLDALEAAGVDNWEGYGYALHEIIIKDEIESLYQDFVDMLHENVLVENTEVDYPAGMDAGASITIDEVGVEIIKKQLNKIVEEADRLNKQERF